MAAESAALKVSPACFGCGMNVKLGPRSAQLRGGV